MHIRLRWIAYKTKGGYKQIPFFIIGWGLDGLLVIILFFSIGITWGEAAKKNKQKKG